MDKGNGALLNRLRGVLGLERARDPLSPQRRAHGSAYGEMTPSGVPKDPVSFQLWSIARHHAAQAIRMVMSHKGTTALCPEIAQLAPHLRTLELRHMPLTDIAHIQTLPHLTGLKIIACPVTDLSALAALPDLTHLEIFGVGAEAMASLPDLPSLRVLRLGSPDAHHLTARMPGLEELHAESAPGLPAAVLREMRNLTQLSVGGLAAPETLSDMTRLRSLKLSTPAPDLSGLRSLKQLQKLDLRAPEATDLAPLSDLNALTDLTLQAPNALSLAPLGALQAVETLRIQFCAPLQDLSWLRSCTALKDLGLRTAPGADLSPLDALTALQNLFLRPTGRVNPGPLTGLPALSRVLLNTRDMQDSLGALPLAPTLTDLILIGPAITSLVGIGACTGLKTLSLQDTGITDLTPISGLPELRKLDLSRGAALDLTPLRTLPRFTEEGTTATLHLFDTPTLDKYPSLVPLAQEARQRDGLPVAQDLARAAVARVS